MENEFDWVMDVISIIETTSVVVGQYYRCTPYKCEDWGYDLDLYVYDITFNGDNSKVHYETRNNSTDAIEFERYNHKRNQVELKLAQRLVDSGYWKPILKEESLYD